MVFINTYRHFIWHSSKHLLSPLLFSATLASDISWPRLPGNRSFIVSVVFEGFSRFFWYMFLKIFCGFEKAVRKVMISRVKFHILMRSSYSFFILFFNTKIKRETCCLSQSETFLKWLNIDNMTAWLTFWTRRLLSKSLSNSSSIIFLFFGAKPRQLQHIF